MKSSGEDSLVSAPKQTALVKTSAIKRAWRKVMFCKVVMVVNKQSHDGEAVSEPERKRVSNCCLKNDLVGFFSLFPTFLCDNRWGLDGLPLVDGGKRENRNPLRQRLKLNSRELRRLF